MRGDATLWFPGLDHAGLSTQVEVRRRLQKEGVRLESLPRAQILAHVEAWKREHETRILAQMRAAGFSVDWSRYRYTMDDGAVRATRKVFVELYQRGLLYRGERIVNWDPKLRTAVSDLEVLHAEEPADLLYVRYPWADGAEGGLVIATVRPETIFGDIAVAVHPDDERHRAAVGRRVRVPLTDRTVPVITDPGVDPTFGNGALKVTPRHDLLDYEIFRRHPDLPMPPSILSPEGVLESEWVPEAFRGRGRDPARSAVAEALQAGGFLEKTERIVHSVGRSERSNAVIEPMLSKQWFVKVRELSGAAVDAVRSGTIRIHPERWTLTFFRWMETLEDWCISRQVVWGHAIPVYYCDACGAETASETAPVRCPKCDATRLTQDPDVLDTWFTSWLWPFLGLGWPEPTADLAHYYPTSVLVTGRDIMFFWVARMMMSGYAFRGAPPFSDVVFTGMLRDDQGRRMSKHLGNSPDPLDLIRERGADALRFAVLFPNPVDQDGAFGSGTLDSSRNFLTKLWNLVRFTLPCVPDGAEPPTAAPVLAGDSALEDRWILSRWDRTLEEFETALARFELTQAASAIYQFVWHDLADRYVEVAKERLQGKRGEEQLRPARATLLFVVDRLLRVLHPMVPHVTEELWHALPHVGDSLSIAAWPARGEASRDPEAEMAMDVLLDAVRAFRNLRAEARVPVAELPEAVVAPAGPAEAELLRQELATVLRLARIRSLTILEAHSDRPTSPAKSVTAHGEFYLLVAPSVEAPESLEREREKLTNLLAKTRARMEDPGFRSRAPPAVVAEAEAKARELEDRLRRIARPAPGVSTAEDPA
jgi:valyl-tRNA synthetase